MNIVFMGTPDFARKSLEAIYKDNHNILAIVTNPDKQKGRGMKFVYSPVKEFAIENNIKIYQPEKVKKNEDFINEIKSLNPDVICVVAYGKILPKEILDIPKFGCINVHASLLPKYRGAAPIQWAIINGEKKTGITTMYMDIGMDTGDMILTEEVDIGEDETTGELWDRLSNIGGKLLVETLKQIEEGSVKRKKQGENFSNAPMLDKSIAKIDWNSKTAIEIKNLVRGLNPIMGAYSIIDDKKLKLWKIDVIDEDIFLENFKENIDEYKAQAYGTIIVSDAKNGLYIKAINGVVKVLELQAENSKKMNTLDYLRGKNLEVGKVLL